MQARYTALYITARHGRDRLITFLLSVETYEPVQLDYLHKCALFDHSASFALLQYFISLIPDYMNDMKRHTE